MSTNSNNTVNNANQGSTSTATAAPTSPTTDSTSIALRTASGQALAGALWEALSQLTDAYNTCIAAYRDIGLDGIEFSNRMTTLKAQADRQKNNDMKYQFIFDAVAQGVGALSTVASMYGASRANKEPSAELDKIDGNLKKLNDKLEVLEREPRAQQGLGDNLNEDGAVADPLTDITNGTTVRDQLKTGDMERYTNNTNRQDDKDVYARLGDADRAAIKDNIKKHIKTQEERQNTFSNIQNRNQTRGQMLNQLATAGANSAAGIGKSFEQEDIGKQDYNSNLSGTAQQQWTSLIGSAASAQSKMADSSNQAIQAYTQMEQSNANPNR